MSTSARLTLGAIASEPSPFELAEDEALARRGDAGSFGVLYERHLAGVFSFLVSRVRTRELAEDLTNEVFREAWTGRRGFRGNGTFRAWLFSIARRTLADHYRRHPSLAIIGLAAADDALDEDPLPEDQAVYDERRREVRRLLNQLSLEQQEILSLRFAAELTYAEIAVVVGKREEAVKKIAYRALESLRGRGSYE